MRALIVHAHPNPESYNRAILDTVQERLLRVGAELRLIDLYDTGFSPALSRKELAQYEDTSCNQTGLEQHCADLLWCDTLIFVYPTWWYGLPAMLKGWLDRVLVPGVAFHMPQRENENIAPGLQHVTRLGVFTTCGASWWLTRMIGAPGKRTLLRGVRLMCAKRCRTAFAAHYLMDSSTEQSRKAHLRKVARVMDRFLKG